MGTRRTLFKGSCRPEVRKTLCLAQHVAFYISTLYPLEIDMECERGVQSLPPFVSLPSFVPHMESQVSWPSSVGTLPRPLPHYRSCTGTVPLVPLFLPLQNLLYDNCYIVQALLVSCAANRRCILFPFKC